MTLEKLAKHVELLYMLLGDHVALDLPRKDLETPESLLKVIKEYEDKLRQEIEKG